MLPVHSAKGHAIYLGHARRIMFGIWSYLRQLAYTKFVIVTDNDINVRDWKDVVLGVMEIFSSYNRFVDALDVPLEPQFAQG